MCWSGLGKRKVMEMETLLRQTRLIRTRGQEVAVTGSRSTSKNLGHSKNLLNVSQVVRDLSAHMHSLTLDPIHSRGTTIFNKTTINQSTELTFLSQYLII